MKKLLISFVLLFSLSVFAQDEMDTTLVVNANGDTIGLVHKKGETPVIPTIVTQAPVKEESVANVNNNFFADSIAKYQKIVDQYLISGNKIRSVGKGLMIAGGIGFGLGVTLMIVGASDTRTDYYGDEDMTSGGEAMFLTGYLLAVSMPELFIAGIVVKCVGSSKLRKAKRMEKKIDNFKMLQNSLATLRVRPVVNPVSGTVGGDLAFNF